MAEFLGRMNELSAARRLRILHSRMEIHAVLWVVLLIGAVPTVGHRRPLVVNNRLGIRDQVLMDVVAHERPGHVERHPTIDVRRHPDLRTLSR